MWCIARAHTFAGALSAEECAGEVMQVGDAALASGRYRTGASPRAAMASQVDLGARSAETLEEACPRAMPRRGASSRSTRRACRSTTPIGSTCVLGHPTCTL